MTCATTNGATLAGAPSLSRARVRTRRRVLVHVLTCLWTCSRRVPQSYAGLVAKMNVRSDPIDNGGTGLWSEADFARIKVERSQAAASTRQPKPPRGAKKGGGEYEFKSPRMSLMERYVKAAGPATERNVVSKEIAEKLERLRSDQRELASFDMHVDELLRSRNKRSVDGPNFPKVNCTPDAIELYSPRSMAHRLAERSEVLSARMAAAQQKAHEAADRRLHEHEEMLNRHERMVARREAQRSREILLRRQSGWVMILALTARAKILEQRIEPERRRRLEDSVARRLQKTYRIQKLRRRLAALAASRRALTKLVWVLRLKLARRRKYTASNKILAFLRGVKGGGTLVMSIRAFSYRVMTTQRLWRKKALMHAAQVELLTLQARREEEKVLREEMMDRHAHGGAASPTPHVDESGEGGEGGEDGLEIVRHEVSMVMPLPESLERVPEEFVREAVSEYLQERRRQRAVILHEYRVALAAHEEFENFNKVLREGVAQSMGDGIHFGITPIAFGGGEIPETLDGYEACVILWRIVNLQRRWRKTHPRTKRPAPPERTETKLAMLSGGANKPEQSIMARSILLQKDAGGRPHAPFLPLTLSKDELGDVLAAAKRLAKKSG